MPIIKDFQSPTGKWMSGTPGSRTKSYNVWYAMKERCKSDSVTQAKNPSYVGCSISEDFLDYQYFAAWCQQQIGYALPGYEIDKDILVKGNMQYAPDKCVFVPKSLNLFLVSRKAERGAYPIGVSACKEVGRYQAHISIDSKLKRLGTFGSVLEAATAYKIAKEAEARRWAQRLQAGEYLVDPRVIAVLQTWTLTL